jgi:hypothetical protein
MVPSQAVSGDSLPVGLPYRENPLTLCPLCTSPTRQSLDLSSAFGELRMLECVAVR